MMKLVATSDLHGNLPEIPTCDVLAIAGDILPGWAWRNNITLQHKWLANEFTDWLRQCGAKHVVLTWGNHDWIAELRPDLIPQLPDNVHVLVNRGVTLDGVHFYGVPQQPEFCNWAFNEADTAGELGKRWEAVDAHTDILITHGPPRGYVDWLISKQAGERVGSVTLAHWLTTDGKRPKWVLCGHLHAPRGHQAMCGRSLVSNVALVDDSYCVSNPPMELEWR